MNRLRQLKKSDWIAIALTGVLILIIAMPLSPKQSDSESTAGQETAATVLDHATIQAIGMAGPGTQDAVGHDFPEPCGILGSQIAGNGCYAVGNRKRG